MWRKNEAVGDIMFMVEYIRGGWSDCEWVVDKCVMGERSEESIKEIGKMCKSKAFIPRSCSILFFIQFKG